MFEFGEVAVEVEGGDEFKHSGGHEKHEAGDHVKAKGVSGIRLHHDRNAVVKEGDGEENADGPTHPGIDVAEGIEEAAEEEWREAVRNGGKALREGVAAMKSAADGFRQGSVDGDDKKGGEKLAGLEDEGLATGEFSQMRGFPLPFAAVHEAITFAEGSEEHDREKVGDEDEKDAAPGVGDAFPGSGGGKDKEESVKHAGRD